MSETPEPANDGSDADDPQKKAEVHTDEAKDRHTSHWDMDYMSADEIEAAYREGREQEQEQGDADADADADADNSDER